MEPLSASISSLFGLLATFLQERQRQQDTTAQATIQEYTEWLRRREHNEVISLLGANREFTLAVQHLLSVGHDELLARLDRLENMLNLVLGSTVEWGELVRSIDPNAGLSSQAIEILRWFDATGASVVFQVNTSAGIVLVPREGGENYSPDENRFFEDDMATLVGLGLLLPGYGSDGSPTFTLTRAAIKLMKTLPSQMHPSRRIATERVD